jgi:hypothetical protein
MANPFGDNPFGGGGNEAPVDFGDSSGRVSTTAYVDEEDNEPAVYQAGLGDSGGYGAVEVPLHDEGDANSGLLSTYGGKKGSAYGDSSSSSSIGGGFPGAESDAEFAIRQREDALQKREQALQQREQELVASGQLLRPKNWPFPGQCALTYHDIDVEIPLHGRSVCRKAYGLFLYNCLCLLWNAVAMMSVVIAEKREFTDEIWCLLYLCFGVPLSWLGWYQSVYQGIRTEATYKWLYFFAYFFIHLCFVVFMAIGVESGAGLLLALTLFAGDGDNSALAGLFCMIGCASSVCVYVYVCTLMLCVLPFFL